MASDKQQNLPQNSSTVDVRNNAQYPMLFKFNTPVKYEINGQAVSSAELTLPRKPKDSFMGQPVRMDKDVFAKFKSLRAVEAMISSGVLTVS